MKTDINDTLRNEGPDVVRDRSDNAAPFKPNGKPKPDERVLIRVAGGQIASIIDRAEAALLAAKVPIMVRINKLVQPIVTSLRAADNQKTTAVLLRPLDAENVIYALNRYAAVFERYDSRRNKWVETDPPDKVADGLLRKGHWIYPIVSGVTTVPTMRADGSIIETPGYDPDTQLWYQPDENLVIPAIKQTPTKDDAATALGLLLQLLDEFPFVDKKLDCSVALAALMTPVLRGAADVVPMFLIRAPDVSNGKSYLVNLCSLIISGRVCPVITGIKNIEEMEKRLGALILEGAPIISLDNCTSDIGGAFLCQVTEQQLVRTRILGQSSMPTCEWLGTAYATGNNVTFLGDMTRRGLICNLDAQTERAEQRTFRQNPKEMILVDRGKYIAAILTISRAYRISKEPVSVVPIASYDKWSKTVREPLIWLGQMDPVKSTDEAREDDPVRSAARRLIELWKSQLKIDTAYTVTTLIKTAHETDPQTTELMYPELRNLFQERAGSRTGQIDAQRLGYWLKGLKNQVHNGYRLEIGKRAHANQYSVTAIETGDLFSVGQ
jgi:putative DNA primase/helicase